MAHRARPHSREHASPTARADEELESYVARAQSRALESMPALSAFQRRMEQYPTLSQEAQAELVAAYQRGMQARASLDAGDRGGRPLRGRERRKAEREAAEAARALDYLVLSNLRLVQLIARENLERRFGRERVSELLPDMVAEGNIALTEAARDFDPERTPRFATYAARVIRDRVRAMMPDDHAMQLPTSWRRVRSIAVVVQPELAASLGRAPTREELQAALMQHSLAWAEQRLSPDERQLPEDRKYELKMARLRKQGTLRAIQDIDDVLLAGQRAASLDAPLSDDSTTTLGDMVPGAEASAAAQRGDDAAFDSVELEELRASLDAALSGLPERDRQIAMYRYGFVDGEEWTYPAIGAVFGITGERVRQIDREILERLRTSDMGETLSAFLTPDQ